MVRSPAAPPFVPQRDLSPNFLFPPWQTAGITAIYASHAQLDMPLVQTLATLAQEGHRIAVIVADNHFDAYEIARKVPEISLQVARAETPYQVRHLVGRLTKLCASFSVAIVIGLLEPFYDEQIKTTVARTVLTDTLRLLNELADTLRVLVLLTPPPNATRPYLLAQFTRTVQNYIELPALTPPKPSPQRRLL